MEQWQLEIRCVRGLWKPPSLIYASYRFPDPRLAPLDLDINSDIGTFEDIVRLARKAETFGFAKENIRLRCLDTDNVLPLELIT